MPCWETSHLASFIMGVVLIPLLFALGVGFKMFVFNHNINFADPLSGLGSTGKVMFHVYRTLLLIVSVAGSMVFERRERRCCPRWHREVWWRCSWD